MLNPNLSKRVAFTITAKNRLASALVCKNSYLKHNPDSDFIIFLADMISEKKEISLIKACSPLIGVHALKDLGRFKSNNKLEEMAYKYDVVEFCTSIKPFCIEYLFWSGYDKVLFFDPDIYFFQSINDIYNALDKFDCLLTPHITKPMPYDHYKQNDLDILKCGVYNLGFGGWSLSQPVLDFMYWWQSKLVNSCFHDIKEHMFVDQYWMNFAPSFLNTYIIKDPTYNVAYWNLHERTISKEANTWLVNNQPLKFYHYSGLEYHDPYKLSIYQNRYNLNNRPELSEFFQMYVRELNQYSATKQLSLPYYYDSKPSGAKVSMYDRRTYNKPLQKTPNPWLVDKKRTAGKTKDGLNVIGYFSYIIGVSEAARNFVQRNFATSIPMSLFPLTTPADKIPLEDEKEFGLYYASQPAHNTSLFFVNLDEMENVVEKHKFLLGKKNIGVCWWEIEDTLPFKQNMRYLSDMVCFTDFVYQIFNKERLSGVTLHKLPYPFVPPKRGSYNTDKSACRAKLGLANDDFVVYSSFDYRSSYQRKNPEGLVAVFAQAFKGKTKCKLVFKTLHAEQFPLESFRLDAACEENGISQQVTMYDGPMCKSDLYAMINMCDMYASLHRSEGCGLSLLDAMYFGKPVLATNYGGNTDFMNNDCALMVDYKKVPVENYTSFNQGGTWAEPNVSHAAELMSKTYADKDMSNKIGLAAQHAIAQYADIYKFNKAIYKLAEEY